MSLFKVPITTIKSISPHFNAERLEIATCYDFNIVVGKNQFIPGERVIFVPIDSILPKTLEDKIFPETSKIKLNKSRVKQIKIRGYPSQGLIITTGDVEELFNINLQHINNETCIAELLGITKYEPPVPEYQKARSGQPRNTSSDHPLFHEYGGCENIKWFSELFNDNEEVVVQEKLHGSNIRAGMLPTQVNGLWKKILNFFNVLPKYERVYGSNRVQISTKSNYKGYYGSDIYGSVLYKVKAFEKIKHGEIIYGELIGHGIQKNYTYGHEKDHHFVLFDVKILQPDGTFKWLSPEAVELYASERGFDIVPTLYNGLFNKEYIYTLTKGDSVYCPQQKVREGIVIKSKYNYNDDSMPSHKKALKWISEDYLSKDQSDFH